MLATTTTVRKLAKAINKEAWSNGWSSNTWTDRAVKKEKDEANKTRRLAFRLYNVAEADKLYEALKTALFVSGYTNTVTRTSSEGDWATHSSGGEYVRVIAVIN